MYLQILAVVSTLTCVAATFQRPTMFMPPHFRPAPFPPFPNPHGFPGPRLHFPVPMTPRRMVTVVKKIDPRSGAWAKVVKPGVNVAKASLVAKHHLFKKMKMIGKRQKLNKMVRLTPHAPLSGGIMGIQRRHPSTFRKYGARRRPGMGQLQRRMNTIGLLRQMRHVRQFQRPIRPISPLRRSFEDDDDDIFDGFNDFSRRDRDNFRDFGAIDDSFDDRFDQSFGHRQTTLPRNFGQIGTSGPGSHFPAQNALQQRKHFQNNRHFDRAPGNTRIPVNAGATGTFGRSIAPVTGHVKGSLAAGILGSFDRKQNPSPPLVMPPGFGSGGILGATLNTSPNVGSDIDSRDWVQDQIMNLQHQTQTLINQPVQQTVQSIPVRDRLTQAETIGIAGEDRRDGFVDDVDNTNELLNTDIRSVADLIAHAGPVFDGDDGFQNGPNVARGTGGIAGSHATGTDDFGRRDDTESPIAGLELLGRSKWGDILHELESVGAVTPNQATADSLVVYPVNPHSADERGGIHHHNTIQEGTFPPGDGFNGLEHEARLSGLGDGAFALLGIDPNSVTTLDAHTREFVGKMTTALELAPEHPPPIFPLPITSPDVGNKLKGETVKGSSVSSSKVIKTIENQNNINDGVSFFESILAAQVIDKALESLTS